MLFVDPRIWKSFPQLRLLLMTGEVEKWEALPDWAADAAAVVAEVRARVGTQEPSALPEISVWREAYRSFGVKPSDARSSIEALTRVVLKQRALRQIHPLVDLYNLLSLRYNTPCGAEDCEKISGQLRLTYAVGTE